MITSLLFFPEKDIIERPEDYGLSAEDVFPVTEDGVKLHGWYLRAKEAQGALLFLHGNAGNISGRLHKAKGWVERGVSVLLLDYRGYGLSEGQIQTGEDIVRDARSGLEWLWHTHSWPMNKIILWGESLGSYPATRLAVEHKTGGLVLEAPFTAFSELATVHYPALPKMLVDAMLKDFRFDNLGLISKVKTSVFIMHGTADATCPYEMGRRLFEAAPEPKLFFSVPDAGHNNLPESSDEAYWEAPIEFLKT